MTGRISPARVAACGAGTGAWLGLPAGLPTTGPAWIGLIVGGVLIGAAFARLAAARHHGSPSLRPVVATRYGLINVDGAAQRARAILGVG